MTPALPSQALHKNAGVAAGRLNFKSMSVWYKTIRPSVAIEGALNSQLVTGKEVTLLWRDSQLKRSRKFDADITRPEFRVDVTGGMPSRVFLFALSEAQVSGDSDINKLIYGDLGDGPSLDVSQVQIRLNQVNFPQTALNINFGFGGQASEEDYVRSYYAHFLVPGMHAMGDQETGSIVSFEEYKSTYPIYVFDLISARSLFESRQDFVVTFSVILRNAANQDYFLYALVEKQRRSTLKGSNEKMLIQI